MKSPSFRWFTLLAAASLGLAALNINAAPQLYQVDFINTVVNPTSDFADGVGTITWDPVGNVMTSFEWDFLEGSEGGQAANWLTSTWLTSPLGTGTNGSALWELLTGQDVFADSISSLDGELYTVNGYPSHLARFLATGQYLFQSQLVNQAGALEAVTVAAGTLTVSEVPEPATLALFGLGLAGLGAIRRDKPAVRDSFTASSLNDPGPSCRESHSSQLHYTSEEATRCRRDIEP